ncbi:MAG: four helix bundle protein [Candidatus Magasanikbacteria bacterium CG10_big_fil_rev_8_21_14_0_10_42_10]|uniref:Four helix bundle protein n=2 Tax=Candidatus Magasanikiibacteriota TaxID=1752731 RepID=A0A2H0TVI9_9BACT|nr:MAG: four helix bundle protein [Candidatus Magasanikbacteria bacterium CG10_big_fil_rev_8_21_14_0_10_42_10]PIZ93604.1 MAG: four helix bundle protein [Candidatus Magasanikbacteria bacterium CG_4_10_14_0_2_um_filter_41_10]
MSTYKDFHDLQIWKTGYELLMNVYTLTASFPGDEKYALSDQLKRSANSIIANIAESHGRYTYKDKTRVLYITRGEIVETRSHLAVAYGRGYIKQSTFTDLNRRYTMLTQQLNLYIKNLQNK